MKKRTGILFTSLFVLGFSLLLVNKNGEEVVRDKSIIIELKDVNGTDVESRNEVEKAFKRELQSVVGLNYRVTSNLKHASNILFLEVNSDDINKIKNLSLVENVKENKTYKIDNQLETFSYDSYTLENGTYKKPDKNYSREAMNIDSSSNDGKNTFVAIIDDSFNLDHEIYKDLTGDLRYSESQISNIVSTASDFTAKKYGRKNNKIPFYYSYLTDNHLDLDYTNNSVYHGQHVAGIAVGNGDVYQGISPKSQVALMKVTNSKGSFSNDEAILKAINDAVILNVDAINMSFGKGIYDFDEKDSMYESVYKKISEKGISSNVAAGNDGRRSNGTSIYSKSSTSSVEDSFLGGESLRDEATTVGSLTVKENKAVDTSLSSEDGLVIPIKDQIVNHKVTNSTTQKLEDAFYPVDPMPFYSLIKDGEETATIDYVVVPNIGDEKDYNAIDVKGKIALIERGEITFTKKVRNAVKNGAIGVIIYNNSNPSSLISYFDFGASDGEPGLEKQYFVPVCGISSSDGEHLKNQKVKKVTIKKELVSDFSSDGSSATLKLKPDISAPGSGIFSSIGPKNNDYAYYDGTSMATPNYTGAFVNALSNFDIKNEETRSLLRKGLTKRLMSTAKPLKQANGAYYSPRLVGSGEVDVASATKTEVYLEGNVEGKSKIELKNNDDIKKGTVKFDVNAINKSDKVKKYKTTLFVQAPQITKIDAYYKDLSKYNFKSNNDVNLLSFSSVIEVKPGENSIEFNKTITDENKKYLDDNFDNGTYLEGYVTFESLDNSVDLSIPYLGFYGDYNKEEPVEPFSFEKESGKAYGSDILNTFLTKDTTSYPNANFSSMWVGLRHGITASEETNVLEKNNNSFLDYGRNVGYDVENNEIIVGVKGVSEYTVIQQYVNRTVVDNEITMTNVETGEKVLTDNMFSIFYQTSNKLHSLYKTMVTSNGLSSGYIADRAYTYLNFSDRSVYKEGLYNFEMKYTLLDGSIFTKTYKVRVGAKNISVYKASFENDKIFVAFDGLASKVTYGGVEAKKVILNKNEYFVIDKKEITNADSTFISVESSSGTTLNGLLSSNDNLLILNKEIPNKGKMKLTKSSSENALDGTSYKYKISVFDASGSKINLKSKSIIVVGSENGQLFDNISAYIIVNSSLTKIADAQNSTAVAFTNEFNEFVVNFNGPQGSSTNLTHLMTLIVSIIIAIIIVIILLLLIKFRNKRVKRK